jgi:hypothetical protein
MCVVISWKRKLGAGQRLRKSRNQRAVPPWVAHKQHTMGVTFVPCGSLALTCTISARQTTDIFVNLTNNCC